MSIDHLKEELANNTAQIIDVRERHEWDMGHLKGAILLPLSVLEEGELPSDLTVDLNKKTYIHCRSGKRVLLAEPLMEDLGFNSIIALDEGFDDLIQAGFEEEA